MFRLVYSHVNQCFLFLFGDSLTDMGGSFLFPTRDDAVAAARDCGLIVSDTGLVAIKGGS